MADSRYPDPDWMPTGEDLDNLRHMVGAELKNEKIVMRAFRNYFAPGVSDLESMQRLLSHGLVTKGRRAPIAGADVNYFHATALGCKAAGLSDKQIDSVLKGS